MHPSLSPADSSRVTLALSLVEGRILGALIEKEFSTPDAYPLTLNSLVNACNQRNNRSPILSLGAREIESALETLRLKRMCVLVSGAEARVPKFRHTLDAVHPLVPIARALFAELLLRGPQTAAELRSRAERLHPMPDPIEVDALLVELERRTPPLTHLLPRQTGQKEPRWTQCLADSPPDDMAERPQALTVAYALPPEIEHRLSLLEAECRQLRTELDALRRSLGEDLRS